MREEERVPTLVVVGFFLLLVGAALLAVAIKWGRDTAGGDTAASASASAPLPISSASAAPKPAHGGTGSPMDKLPDFQMYKSGDGMCLVLRSQEWAKKSQERWGLPYPYHMAIWHKGEVLEESDCGFFPGLQKGSSSMEQAFYRVAFCLDDHGDREPRRLALTKDKERLHLMLTFPKNDAGNIPMAMNYGWFVKTDSCGSVGK